MTDFAPVLAYLALFAYLPLLFVTARTVSGKKLRDRTFLRALAKDYLRTAPICAVVALPVLAFPGACRPYAVILHLVFFLPLCLELGHVHLFKTRVGLNTFYSLFVSNARETREFFAQNVSVAQGLLVLAVGFAPPFALVRLPVPQWTSVSAQIAGCAFAVALGLPFFLNLMRRPEKRKDGYVLNPFVNLPYHYIQFRTHYRELQEQIARHSAPPFEGIVSRLPADEPQTYVIVIGESSNAMHHGYCGYARATNEFTDRLGDEMLRFRGVRSPFAQTIPSLEKTITFADNAHPELVWTKGSLIDYFKDAGFETYWLSNQYALDDTALTAMTSHADVCKCYNFSGMKRFEKAGLDEGLLPDFARYIRGGRRKKAVFLHLIGSHAAYVNRYPDSFRHFEGQAPGKNLPADRAQMLNSYDDSIRYTDWVVSEFVRELKAVGGASYLLYFADHGEDVFDSRDDRILGHGPLANLPMTSVPFMLWVSPRLAELRGDIRGGFAAARDAYDLQDAIHTIIGISSLANRDFDPGRTIFRQSDTGGDHA